MYTYDIIEKPITPKAPCVLDSRIFFDIETIKCQNPDARQHFYDKAKPPANTKDKDAWYGSAKHEDAAQKAFDKTAFDGLFGEVVSICWGHYDYDGNWHEYGATRDDIDTEVGILNHFFGHLNDRIVKGPVFVGDNIIGFDLVFLQNRALVNELQLPAAPQWPRNVKPWSNNVEDLLLLVSGGNKYEMPSMDTLAFALGQTGKEDVDGSMVGDLFDIGEFQIIHDYCQSDVRKSRDQWARFVNSRIIT